MSNAAAAQDQGLPIEQQLESMAELVSTGPVDLGCYTQAEMAVVLGEAPALAGLEDDVLAEGVRSLAARGLLYRAPDGEHVDIVGELGLVAALIPLNTGTIEVRRGHEATADSPWRWLISLLPGGVAAVDRIDALGLHRLSMVSLADIDDALVEQFIDGPARIPSDDPGPIAITVAELRHVAERAPARWQLAHRVRRTDGTVLEVEVQVLRSGPRRVDLITRDPQGDGYQRVAVDADALRMFLDDLAGLT